jgi:hypothetical protein
VYNDLPHPPSGYLSRPDFETVPMARGATRPGGYPARSNDGSGYNPLFPDLGKAGEPYARSVPSLHYTPQSSLPDAGIVFDTLLKRTEFREHPGGINGVGTTSRWSSANADIHTAVLCVRKHDHSYLLQHEPWVTSSVFSSALLTTVTSTP